VITERTVAAGPFTKFLDIAALEGKLLRTLLGIGYTNLPNSKNLTCRSFLENTNAAEDTLVMLRSNQEYPPDIVEALAGVERGVTLGPGHSLAIKRWVLERLQWQGHEFFFKHKYDPGCVLDAPNADGYFVDICRRCGIDVCVVELDRGGAGGDGGQQERMGESAPTEVETTPAPPRQRIFWAVPLEREIMVDAFRAFLDVAMHAGAFGATRIGVPLGDTATTRNRLADTATTRNRLCYTFLDASELDSDKLIMLDADHAHPADIVPRLAVRPEGVIGALYFRRGEPHDPMYFMRREDRHLSAPANCRPFVYPCAIVGTGAIGIKRWVLDRLQQAGHEYFFKYKYPQGSLKRTPSEDIYFGQICEEIDIKHHVDCSLITEHLNVVKVNREDWNRHKPDNTQEA
jgi:hypothetical protein